MVMSLGFELGDFINLFHFAINLERAPTNPFLDHTSEFLVFIPSLPHILWQKKLIWQLSVLNLVCFQ